MKHLIMMELKFMMQVKIVNVSTRYLILKNSNGMNLVMSVSFFSFNLRESGLSWDNFLTLLHLISKKTRTINPN